MLTRFHIHFNDKIAKDLKHDEKIKKIAHRKRTTLNTATWSTNLESMHYLK